MHYLQRELFDQTSFGKQLLPFMSEAASDGIWFRDIEAPQEQWMSDGFWKVLGYVPGHLPHKAETWRNLIHPQDLPRAVEALEAHIADTGQIVDVKLRLRHGVTGQWVWMQCLAVALRDSAGKPIRLFGLHFDLSARKRTDDQLRGALEDVLVARAHLEAALTAKSRFIDALDNEIRTPMRAILGVAETLLMQDLSESVIRQVAIIARSASTLLTMIANLSEASRFDADGTPVELDVVAPMRTVREAAEACALSAGHKGISLRTTGRRTLPARIVASEWSLRQVVTMLVDNALGRSKDANVEVQVALRGTVDPQEDTLSISVVDHGSVIPDTMKARAFDPVVACAGTGERAGNTSQLRLAVAQQLCHLHGGGISIHDTPGGGATFEATFAVRPAWVGAQGLHETRGDAKAQPRLRLLLVDENETHRAAFAALVDHVRADLTFVSNTAEAMSRMAHESFDAALVDIRAPVGEGVAFAEDWRKQEYAAGVQRLPLIACSAHDRPEQVQRYLSAGFDWHLSRPITIEGLLDCMEWIHSEGASKVS